MLRRWKFQLFAAALFMLLLCTSASAAHNGYLVDLKSGMDLKTKELLDSAKLVYGPDDLYLVQDDDVIRQLRDLGAVESCSENSYIQLDSLDAEFTACRSDNWGRAMVGWQYAQSNSITGANVRVGIIDSGISSKFSTKNPNVRIEQGTNYLVAEYSADRHNTEDHAFSGEGHGTFVASIIADSACGVAGGVTIVPLKCFDSGSDCTMDILISAIDGAIEANCDVVNMSLSTTQSDTNLEKAIRRAQDAGIIIVASSGNEYGSKLTYNHYPACYSGVICVGSVDSSKQIAVSSVRNSSVNVVAPGEGITGLNADGQYASNSGTSFSSPMVCAAAALAHSVDPTLTSERFLELLELSCEDLGAKGWDKTYGYGLLNIGLLLAIVRNDADSLTYSYANGVFCYSAYIPPLSARHEQTLLAYYQPNGRFALAGKWSAAEQAQILCNVPAPYVTGQLRMLHLSSSFQPTA